LFVGGGSPATPPAPPPPPTLAPALPPTTFAPPALVPPAPVPPALVPPALAPALPPVGKGFDDVPASGAEPADAAWPPTPGCEDDESSPQPATKPTNPIAQTARRNCRISSHPDANRQQVLSEFAQKNRFHMRLCSQPKNLQAHAKATRASCTCAARSRTPRACPHAHSHAFPFPFPRSPALSPRSFYSVIPSPCPGRRPSTRRAWSSAPRRSGRRGG
jgi:hypothetical protein